MSTIAFHLAQEHFGGPIPAHGSIGRGAGLILFILVAVVLGWVLAALIRAGRRPR